MSVMDKLKDMLRGHSDQANKGVEKVGDFVDDKTGGKYRDQVGSAKQKAKDQIRGGGGHQDRNP
jgi:MT0933-like antitoxin protein